MTKLITFDDNSKLTAKLVERKGDVTDIELESGEIIGVSSDRIKDVTNITEKTMDTDGLHGTITLQNGNSMSLPFTNEGFAYEILGGL